jgi:hypothetical protein
MPDLDLEKWEAQEPPRGFAARVVGAAQAEHRIEKRRRGGRVFAGLLVVVTMAAAIVLAFRLKSAAAHGDVVADARREVRVGTRAVAVLEKGAHVVWDGDSIKQSDGDVFWRVEPGARFTVATPVADVTVKGTCFRVKVRSGEDDMNRRDVAAATMGAALAAATFVGVYEGKVAVSHAGTSVDVGPGQGVRADGAGVGQPGEAASTELGFDRGAPPSESAFAEANANLANTVSDYRRRLEANESDKEKLEAKLKEAERRLAIVQNDGAPPKSEWDLSEGDWKELEKQGTVKARYPCDDADPHLSTRTLDELGLSPSDAPTVEAALARSDQRLRDVVIPLCAQIVGSAELANRLGESTCIAVVRDSARGEHSADAIHLVAAIRAGDAPVPGPNDKTDARTKLLLAETGALTAFEGDLAQAFGPEEAHRIATSDSLGMCKSVYRSGNGPPAP